MLLRFADDIYGKWKMSPSKDRASLRAKIPLSISRAFTQAVTQVR